MEPQEPTPLPTDPAPLEAPLLKKAVAPTPFLHEFSIVDTLWEKTIQSQNRRERARVVETDSPYRWIRIEETFELDPNHGQYRAVESRASVASQFIVKLAEGSSEAELRQLVSSLDLSTRKLNGSERLFLVEQASLVAIEALPEKMALLGEYPDIAQFAEPDYLLYASATIPNDPRFSEQTALNSGSQFEDIDAPEGWELSTSAPNIVVAVIDSGARVSHQDLEGNLWRNAAETPNGIDDDNNGIVDDLHGLNAIDDSGDLSDLSGHGTHVAGTIGAVGNNGLGITGVAWDVQIMPLKFLGKDGSGATSDAIECIYYAIEKGADVINNSWGGSGKSASLQEALEEASKKGILIATAAGNEGNDLGSVPAYPAAYRIPNQVVVAGIDRNGTLSSFSNRSSSLVHIAAPSRALSASHSSDEAYKELLGTSMATPHVAGTMALLLNRFPQEPASFIVSRLLDSTVLLPSLANLCSSEGRLSLYRALAGITNAPINDQFVDAIPIDPYGGRGRGTTSKATSDENEPQSSRFSKGSTVWHRWTGTHDGNGLVSVDSTGFPPALSIYEGSSIETLQPVASASSIIPSDTIEVSFQFSQGGRYYFQIDSVGNSEGPYSIELAVAPQNDAFRWPETLNGDSFFKQGSNRGAVNEPGESLLHPSAAGASVWYRWTSPKDGEFYLKVDPSLRDKFVRIYTGDAIDALTLVESQFEENSESNQVFAAVSGKSYTIAIDSLSSSGTEFTLSGEYLSEPKILVQPKDFSTPLGKSAAFSVSVYGLGTPAYQWQKDRVDILGATSSSYRIAETSQDDLGKYRVRIQIAGKTLYTREALLSSAVEGIFVLRHPSPQSIREGEDLSLRAFVTASGQDVSFQWFKDNLAIPGADQTRLDIANAVASDSGFYRLEISQDATTFTSKSAYALVSDDSGYESFAWANMGGYPNQVERVEIVGGYYIATGGGRLSFSLDGIDWQYTPMRANQVAQGNGYFLIATDSGIARSPNLSHWEMVSETNERVERIVFANDMFVARMESGLYYSSDGAAWTLGLAIPNDYNATLKHENGHFIANSPGHLHISDDGKTWQTVTTPMSGWNVPTYGQGRWWLLGSHSSELLFVSSDGENWTEFETGFHFHRSIIVDPVADEVYLLADTQVDPSNLFSEYITELYQLNEDTFLPIKRISQSHFNYIPLILANDGDVTFLDQRGLLSLEEFTPFSGLHYDDWWHEALISYANGRFITGHRNTLRSSSDGANWITESTTSENYGTFVYGNGVYLGSNHVGPTLSTLDAHNRNFQSLAFGKGLFVALSGNDILYSSDGREWIPALSNTGNLATVIFGGERFIAYYDSNIYVSNNGINWSKSPAPAGLSLERIVYGNGRFLSFDSGTSYTSTDGLSWRKGGSINIPGRSSSGVDWIMYSNGKFILEYWDEFYYESADGSQWTLMSAAPFEFPIFGRPKYAYSDTAILYSTDIGFGIFGKVEADDMVTLVSSPANRIKTQAGTSIEIEFDSYSSSSPINRTEVYIDGTLRETLLPSQTRFTYTPPSAGQANLEIISYNEDGDQSSDRINVTAAPSLHTTLAAGEFWLHSLVYHKGAFYGGGDGGRIFVSTNGKDWKGVQTPTLDQITDLAANQSAIVARHKGGGILYSSNGIEWMEIGGFQSFGLHIDGDLFVAGTNDAPAISKDGKTWYSANTGISITGVSAIQNEAPVVFNGYHRGAYLGGPGIPAEALSEVSKVLKIGEIYVGLRSDQVVTSENLTSWTPIPYDNESIDDILLIGGLAFVIRSGGIEYVSGDGIEWLRPNTKWTSDRISYSDGYFYNVQGVDWGEPDQVVMRSTNGIEWEQFGSTIETERYNYRIDHIAASPIGAALSADDNGTIHYFFLPTEGPLFHLGGFDSFGFRDEDIKILGDDTLFAVTDYPSYRRAEDGLWYQTDTRIQDDTVFANGFFFGEWHNQGFVRSQDGLNWTNTPYPNWLLEIDDRFNMERVFSEGNLAVWFDARYTIDGHYHNAIGRSSNGLDWERITLAEAHPGIGKLLAFKNESYFESNNRLYRWGSNYETWTEVYYSEDQQRDSQILDVASTSERIGILSGSNGMGTSLDSSTNGIIWERHSLPVSGYFRLAATEEAFYVFENSVWKSTDGREWTEIIPFEARVASNGREAIFYTDNLTFVDLIEEDIAIESLAVDSKDYAVGDDISISFELTNKGDSIIDFGPNKRVRYLFSQEENRWSHDSNESSFEGIVDIPFETLAPGESRSFATTVEVPSSIAPSQYYLSVAINDELIPKDGNPSNDFFFGDASFSINVPARELVIQAHENGYVSGAGNKTKFAWKDSVELRAIPDFGYEFAGWKGDLSYPDELLSLSMEQDISIQPVFVPRSYLLEIDTIGNGSVNSGSEAAIFNFGDSIDLEATPEEGWVFLGWSGYGRSSSRTLSASVGKDLKITAQFGLPYTTWADIKYTENSEQSGPEANSPIPGVSNMEFFSLGLDFPDQIDIAAAGVRREGNLLILRYTLFKGLYDFSVQPVYSSDLENWSSGRVLVSQIGETGDLRIMEAKIPFPTVGSTGYLSLLIKPSEDTGE